MFVAFGAGGVPLAGCCLYNGRGNTETAIRLQRQGLQKDRWCHTQPTMFMEVNMDATHVISCQRVFINFEIVVQLKTMTKWNEKKLNEKQGPFFKCAFCEVMAAVSVPSKKMFGNESISISQRLSSKLSRQDSHLLWLQWCKNEMKCNIAIHIEIAKASDI